MSSAEFEALVDGAGMEEEVVALVAVSEGWFESWQFFAFDSWYRNWFTKLTPEEGFTHLELLKLTVKNIYNLDVDEDQGEEEIDGSITWDEWAAMTVEQQTLYIQGGGDAPVLALWEALPAPDWGFDQMTWVEWIGLGSEQRAYWIWAGGSAPTIPNPIEEQIPWLDEDYWESRTEEERQALLDAGFREPPEPGTAWKQDLVSMTEEAWDLLTEDQKEDLLEYGSLMITEEFWDLLSDDEKQVLLDQGYAPPAETPPAEDLVSYTAEEWSELSEEEKAAALEDAAENGGTLIITEEFWDALTDEEQEQLEDAGYTAPRVTEERPDLVSYTAEEWDELSDEEKEEALENGLLIITQEFWDNLTDEEKEKLLERGYTAPRVTEEREDLADGGEEEEEEEAEPEDVGFVFPEGLFIDVGELVIPGTGVGLNEAGFEAVEEEEEDEPAPEPGLFRRDYQDRDGGDRLFETIGDQDFGDIEAPKVPHQPGSLFGRLSSDSDRAVNWETQPGEPVHGEKRRLAKYSPFMIWVEPPNDEHLYLDPLAKTNPAAITGPKSISVWSGSASEIHTSAEGYSSQLRTSLMNQALRPYNPALFTCNQLADMHEQYLSMARTPALLMLINPNDMNVTYNKLQQFTERTRQGYIFKAWGHEPTTISFSGQIGAFYAGESNSSDVKYSGEFITETDNPTGNQERSRRFAASYQNLMNLQSLYLNNGYIRDRANSTDMRPSLGHHQIGTVNIWFDGVHYRGHFDKLEYSFEEKFNRGGLSYSFDFTAMEIIDKAESPVMLSKLDEPSSGGGMASGSLLGVGDSDITAPADWSLDSIAQGSPGEDMSTPWDTEGWDDMDPSEQWLAILGGSPDPSYSSEAEKQPTGHRGFQAGDENADFNYYVPPEGEEVEEEEGEEEGGGTGAVPGGSGSDYDNDPEPGPEDEPADPEDDPEVPDSDPEGPADGDPGETDSSAGDGTPDGVG